jgi:hypothetical protein
VRVNLIRSILVFQEKKYCLHENAKLVFFKKKYTKTIHTQKKKVHSNSASELHCAREHKFEKAARSCFTNFAFKT